MSATVDNGRIAQAEFNFYSGQVGVRERGEHLEAAYFGRAPNVRLPVVGTLDGQQVRVVDVQSRPLSSTAADRAVATRAITLTIVLL